MIRRFIQDAIWLYWKLSFRPVKFAPADRPRALQVLSADDNLVANLATSSALDQIGLFDSPSQPFSAGMN